MSATAQHVQVVHLGARKPQIILDAAAAETVWPYKDGKANEKENFQCLQKSFYCDDGDGKGLVYLNHGALGSPPRQVHCTYTVCVCARVCFCVRVCLGFCTCALCVRVAWRHFSVSVYQNRLRVHLSVSKISVHISLLYVLCWVLS